MPLIYVQLGVGYSSFDDEELDFHLNDVDKPAGQLDFSNINANIIAALNVGRIVQINGSQFSGIGVGITPSPPLQASTNFLISLTNVQGLCPNPNFMLFGYYAGQWYKVLWSTLQACIGTKAKFVFQIGQVSHPYPENGDTAFTHPTLVGQDPQRLLVEINGIPVFHESQLTAAEISAGATDYFKLNNLTGVFTRPLTPFADGDKVRILGV